MSVMNESAVKSRAFAVPNIHLSMVGDYTANLTWSGSAHPSSFHV